MSRAENRKPIKMVADCRTVNQRTSLEVSNFSSGGCKIALGKMRLSVGQVVIIRPESMECLPSVVKWCKDGFAGLQFNNKVYGPIVDHLCNKYLEKQNFVEVEFSD